MPRREKSKGSRSTKTASCLSLRRTLEEELKVAGIDVGSSHGTAAMWFLQIPEAQQWITLIKSIILGQWYFLSCDHNPFIFLTLSAQVYARRVGYAYPDTRRY
jgi:hypothetical protein